MFHVGIIIFRNQEIAFRIHPVFDLGDCQQYNHHNGNSNISCIMHEHCEDRPYRIPVKHAKISAVFCQTYPAGNQRRSKYLHKTGKERNDQACFQTALFVGYQTHGRIIKEHRNKTADDNGRGAHEDQHKDRNDLSHKAGQESECNCIGITESKADCTVNARNRCRKQFIRDTLERSGQLRHKGTDAQLQDRQIYSEVQRGIKTEISKILCLRCCAALHKERFSNDCHDNTKEYRHQDRGTHHIFIENREKSRHIHLADFFHFSPNDSANARIVIVTPAANGDWEVRTLCRAPFVHRFGILNRAGRNYLIVCCLKTGHEYKDDWRFKGACFGALLPSDLSSFNEEHPLELTLVKDEMLKNHGFSLLKHGGHDAALIACEEGTFLFDPPAVSGAGWNVTQISPLPSSDSVLIDLDGDGRPELGCISPFHGSSLVIYHLDEHDHYVPQWKYSRPESETGMIHATWTCTLLGKPTWITGWRKGTKDTIAITWDAEAGTYRTEYIDQNTGCANVLHFVNKEGKDVIVAANREIDEAALYTVTE